MFLVYVTTIDATTHDPCDHVQAKQWANDEPIKSSPLGQNGRHLTDDIFKFIFMNENFYILIRISLKFVLKGPNDNNQCRFR